MWTTKTVDSPIFARTVRGAKRLSSPFARNFDVDEWDEVLKKVENLSERDFHLAASAIFFGHNVRGLREVYIKKTFDGISRRSAIILAIASANRNYFKVSSEFRDAVRLAGSHSDGRHLSEMAEASLPGTPQSGMSADDIIGTIVDTLPHWLFQTKALGDVRESKFTDFGKLELSAGMTLSVENGLKDLWNAALWEDYRLERREEELIFGPHDRKSAEYWHACQKRTEAAYVGPAAMFNGLPEAVETRDVELLGISGLRKKNGEFRFVTGKPSRNSRNSYLSREEHIQSSYLADYLDATISLETHEVSLRLLYNALWLLSDMVRFLKVEIKPKFIKKYADAKAFSLIVQKSEIVRVLQLCLGTSHQVTKVIVEHLSIDPSDTKKCFAEGLWIHPIVKLSENESMLVAPSLLAGSPIRFGEKTLIELSDNGKINVREQGMRFEQRVRDETVAALSENDLLSDCVCLPTSLKRVGHDGEEIDLILRIGSKIIVGEVKCFVAPSESIERFNYIGHLEGAAEQAVRKCDWVRQNFDQIAQRIGGNQNRDEVAFVPVVILNQRLGSGLVINDATITDFSLWKLYFSDSQYASGAVLLKEQRAVTFTTFYENQSEAETQFEFTFQNPPPLLPFLKNQVWEKAQFPTSEGFVQLERPKIKVGQLITVDLASAMKAMKGA